MRDDVEDLDKLSDELISRVETVLANADSGPDRDVFEARYQDMKTKLAKVKDTVQARHTEIDEKAPMLYKYFDLIENFVAWLTEFDRKLSSQGPVSCEKKMIIKQLEQMEALSKDFESHTPDYGTVKETATTVINGQPDDVYVVEAQLLYIEKLWDSINLRLKDRQEQINNVKGIAEEYQKAQRPVRALFAWAEEAVLPAETIGASVDKAKQELNNTKVGN